MKATVSGSGLHSPNNGESNVEGHGKYNGSCDHMAL